MENKAYYAVLCADVRYDTELPVNAKLLYAEITALSNQQGYCWASNNYFAELYGVTERSIRRWINILVDKGYISRMIEYGEDGKTIKRRRLSVGKVSVVEGQTATNECHEMSVGTDKIVPTPTDKNVRKNIININNINNNPPIEVPPKKFVRPSIKEVATYCRGHGYKVDAQQFFDFYESNGWRVGKNLMKDWQACIRTWERREQNQLSKECQKAVTAKSAEELSATFGDIKPEDI